MADLQSFRPQKLPRNMKSMTSDSDINLRSRLRIETLSDSGPRGGSVWKDVVVHAPRNNNNIRSDSS